ncbi:hypothetical protein J7E24_08630 [Hymenobacter sp. ISL-91]|uniref:hypothetical protein n=1 Tax=Hymenobacter sp. ISL-91 TaxID=2819151 RepID=UPI001BEA99C0|nr:hypothetical protein [Hymenobacter sp. ISL-91]MBT2557848.1 hypothetical protein [Hymenobacter sp. ISL-91]
MYAVLQTVRASAETNAQLLRKNEAATRAALIDPVLRALGWDTADVRMVEPEKTIGVKQALDYVLYDATGAVSVVIEAKKLGESLDKLGHIGAAIGYAFSLKPQKLFITDGLHWHYYSPGHSNFQPVETISLLKTPLVEAALHLLQWLDAAQSGHGVPAAEPTARAANPTAATGAAAVSKSRRTPLPLPGGSHTPAFVELAQVSPQALAPGQKPTALRLPNGAVVPIKTWKDVLVQLSLFVLQQRPSVPVPHPDKAGKKTALFSWNKPKEGIGYKETTLHGRPLYIHTNYSAASCVANALHVLRLLPEAATAAVAF